MSEARREVANFIKRENTHPPDFLSLFPPYIIGKVRSLILMSSCCTPKFKGQNWTPILWVQNLTPILWVQVWSGLKVFAKSFQWQTKHLLVKNSRGWCGYFEFPLYIMQTQPRRISKCAMSCRPQWGCILKCVLLDLQYEVVVHRLHTWNTSRESKAHELSGPGAHSTKHLHICKKNWGSAKQLSVLNDFLS